MKQLVRVIHFTGIGGIGMSGIAEVLHNQGFVVQGSDLVESATVARLRRLGIPVWRGHRAEHLGAAEVVVVTSAVRGENPEVAEAHARGIPVIPRAEMLAELMRMKRGVAVAGSHGKTTITSLIAHGMEQAGFDPTFVIGGRLIAGGENARLGASPWLVAEADESDGSFLRLSPMITVISNIDPEHLDHYGTVERLEQAFTDFANRTPFYGCAVLHHSHPRVAGIRARLHKPVRTYGVSPQADVTLQARVVRGMRQQLTVAVRGEPQPLSLELALPGAHNAENVLAAVAVLHRLGVDPEAIAAGIASFGGIERRFQVDQLLGGVLVDDYGHHPAEIAATIATAREAWPDRRLVALFQPHRYSRTQALLDRFADVFDAVHELHLLPIYSAGEEPIAGADSAALADRLRRRGHRAVALLDDLDAAEACCRDRLAAGGVVLLLGAGSIGSVARALRGASG
ncbi:MAG: UDP-N-acetylmuramate--L-alanine ligase [Zetaproteobacteria bacterium]|nr:MAG: UDP-N-acetylmuramate--L-alanine ligase [Zetaproteobacteria bacterium]